MVKHSENSINEPEFERVGLEELVVGRRGKHHQLVGAVLDDLATLPANSAMKIPVERLAGISPARIRSAVSRATKNRRLRIATHFDGKFLYIWKPDEADVIGRPKVRTRRTSPHGRQSGKIGS